ncbi:MAG: SDR family oxidoreductase [Chloroflexota bacterium]|nr:MAG: SDR family oxidoreductase [Chloroflexota bacterium]
MLEKKVVLVTGASSGIGEATARAFAREGYQVALAARRFDRLQALAEEIELTGGDAFPIAADVSKIEDIQKMVSETLEHYRQIDVLFNNAGFGRLDWLENLDPVEDIDTQIRVNLLGVIQTARAVLPNMLFRRKGHIINMASIAGLVATPTYTIYAASKFGMRGFTEALRREVGVYGIHVSGIYPGGVKTEFSDHARIRRKTGVTTPAVLRLTSEQVAEAVLRLVRRPRRTMIIPWPMTLFAWINALVPGLVDWVLDERFVKPERGL